MGEVRKIPLFHCMDWLQGCLLLNFGDMGGRDFSKMRYCLWGRKVVILQCDWKVENSRTKGANMADNGEQKDNHGRDVCIRKVVYVSPNMGSTRLLSG